MLLKFYYLLSYRQGIDGVVNKVLRLNVTLRHHRNIKVNIYYTQISFMHKFGNKNWHYRREYS